MVLGLRQRPQLASAQDWACCYAKRYYARILFDILCQDRQYYREFGTKQSRHKLKYHHLSSHLIINLFFNITLFLLILCMSCDITQALDITKHKIRKRNLVPIFIVSLLLRRLGLILQLVTLK